MKKSKEIIGLAVVSIQEGKELGTVRQLLVDAGQGTVAALLVDDCEWYFGAKLLPFSGVNALGENAVTINSENDITPVAKISDFDSLLKNNVSIIGSTVITIAGNVVGTVVEILIDTDGKIVGCQIDTADEDSPISAEQVITYGRDALIISLDGEPPRKKLPKAPAPISKPDIAKEPVEEAPVQVKDETVAETAIEEPVQSAVETSVEAVVEEPVIQQVEASANPIIEEPAQTVSDTPVEPAVEKAAALPVEPIAAEPVNEKAAQSVESVVEPVIEPVIEPVVEPIVQPVAQPTVPEIARGNEETAAKSAAAAPAANENDALAKMFEEKQRRYLLGKKANRLIQTDSGVTIIEPGGEITEAVLQKAKLAGKFLELSMSVH